MGESWGSEVIHIKALPPQCSMVEFSSLCLPCNSRRMANQSQHQGHNQDQSQAQAQAQPAYTGVNFLPAGHIIDQAQHQRDQDEPQAETDTTRDQSSAHEEASGAAAAAEREWFISTAFTCGRCKQIRVAYSQVQIRPEDEPMTTYCECTICGNLWKYS